MLWWRGDYGALIDKLNIAVILLQMWVSMPIFEMLASVNHLLINLLWPSRCRSIKSLPQFSLQIFWNFWQREIFLQGNIKPAHHHRWPDPNFFSWLNFFTDLVWTKLFFESLSLYHNEYTQLCFSRCPLNQLNPHRDNDVSVIVRHSLKDTKKAPVKQPTTFNFSLN